MIHFPPSEKSKYCMKDPKDILCDKVDWTVKVGSGFFVVKLFFGDPTVKSKIDLSINKKSAFSGIVEKGKLKIVEKKVESIKDHITISSECEIDCNFSMAKLSAVEIIPFEEKQGAGKEPPRKVEKCGGSLIRGMHI